MDACDKTELTIAREWAARVLAAPNEHAQVHVVAARVLLAMAAPLPPDIAAIEAVKPAASLPWSLGEGGVRDAERREAISKKRVETLLRWPALDTDTEKRIADLALTAGDDLDDDELTINVVRYALRRWEHERLRVECDTASSEAERLREGFAGSCGRCATVRCALACDFDLRYAPAVPIADALRWLDTGEETPAVAVALEMAERADVETMRCLAAVARADYAERLAACFVLGDDAETVENMRHLLADFRVAGGEP